MPPCFAIFNDVPALVLIMGTMIRIVFFAIWIIFSVKIINEYRGRFWFYACASLVYSVLFFTLILGRLAGALIPFTVQGVTLVSGVSAVLFVLLAVRLLYPEHAPLAAPAAEPAISSAPLVSYTGSFKEHKLTNRETIIARLLVEEGLGNNQIAARIFRSVATVEFNITNIYRKFNVQSRAEFLALFVNKEQGTGSSEQ
jgi:DNA-binding CsgD family transcriptional regulator